MYRDIVLIPVDPFETGRHIFRCLAWLHVNYCLIKLKYWYSFRMHSHLKRLDVIGCLYDTNLNEQHTFIRLVNLSMSLLPLHCVIIHRVYTTKSDTSTPMSFGNANGSVLVRGGIGLLESCLAFASSVCIIIWFCCYWHIYWLMKVDGTRGIHRTAHLIPSFR